MNDDKPPIPLEYQPAPRPGFWPRDPFAPPRLLGIVYGFLVPFPFIMWAQWGDRIIRVPPLWYQQSWVSFIAFLFAVSMPIIFFGTRFRMAFALGLVIAIVVLLLNYMVEVVFFGVDLLERITGHSWN
jgi:hypothetical protein